MRALLANSARPTIHSPGLRGVTSSGLLTRQTVFRPARRKLTFKDAFAILLAPVLTAAFVVDATSKERTRLAWEKKIAEIQEEIEELREREIQTWSALQLRSLQAGIRSQRRAYSTVTQPFAPFAQSTEGANKSFLQELVDDEPMFAHERRFSENGTREDTGDEETFMDLDRDLAELGEGASDKPCPSSIPLPLGQLNPAEIAECRRYELLIASKMALEMLLHLRTGKSVLKRLPSDIIPDSSVYPDSLDRLNSQLNAVRQSLKYITKIPGPIPEAILNEENRKALQVRILDLTTATKEGRILTRDLVHGYANAIAEFKIAPTAETYRLMVETLSLVDNDTLVYTAMGALQFSRQTLDNSTLWTMIYQYGHFRDGGRFQDFLLRLTQHQSIISARTKWNHVVVDDMRVVVPTSQNPGLLSALVRAGLCCDQPHHAEAWTKLLLQSNAQFRRIAYVYYNIIKYYAENANWKYGYRWMLESLKWMAVMAHELTAAAVHTILRILELCVACDQVEIYERVIEAAIEADIFLPKIDTNKPDSRSERMKSIYQDWNDRMDAHNLRYKSSSEVTATKIAEGFESTKGERQRKDERILLFQDLLSKRFPILSPYVGVVSRRIVLELLGSEKDEPNSHTAITPFQPVRRITSHQLVELQEDPDFHRHAQESKDSNEETFHYKPRQERPIVRQIKTKTLYIDALSEQNEVLSEENEHLKAMFEQNEDLKEVRKTREKYDELQAKCKVLHQSNLQLAAKHNALYESNKILMAKLRDLNVNIPNDASIPTTKPRTVQMNAYSETTPTTRIAGTKTSALTTPQSQAINPGTNQTRNLSTAIQIELPKKTIKEDSSNWKTHLQKLRQQRHNLVEQQWSY